jgi:hypothetical protein
MPYFEYDSELFRQGDKSYLKFQRELAALSKAAKVSQIDVVKIKNNSCAMQSFS